MAPITSSLRGSITALLLALAPVRAVPGPGDLGSDLTILTHNDLYGNSSVRSDAVIVLGGAKTHRESHAACRELGEELWVPPSEKKNKPSDNFLAYIGYGSHRESDDLYWISGPDCKKCEAINPRGEVRETPCDRKLGALCTQSAPLTYSFKPQDTQKKWQTTVQTGKQSITGFRDKFSFRFEGIRYAAEPKRFTYSELFRGSGDVSALEYAPQCYQTGCDSATCSEDCLFLNVYSPYLPGKSHSKLKLRPVMFWIHGGAFTGGTGGDPTFDGTDMASRGDVVVVTINYRLSTLGFLALDDGKTNGNFGFADQTVALDWVREHIKDFGGDPDRVTIFGQSAGASSVRAHLGSPKSIGKYAAAISMSNLGGLNYGTTYSKYYTISDEVSEVANPILNATKCLDAESKVDCLRKVEALDLVNQANVARFLVVDGTYIKTSRLQLDASEKVAHVPVMMGSMRDDGAALIGYPDTTDVEKALSDQDFDGQRIVKSGKFPAPDGANATLNAFNVTARVATDGEFRCLDQASAYAAVKNKLFPAVYSYEFDRSYQMAGFSPNAPVCEAPKTKSYPFGDTTRPYFRCHSGELFYVWGVLSRMGIPPRDDFDIPFSQFAIDTWTSFARSYNPNPDPAYLEARGYSNTTSQLKSSGNWHAVKAESPKLRNLAWPSQEVPFKDGPQCDVLDLPLHYYI